MFKEVWRNHKALFIATIAAFITTVGFSAVFFYTGGRNVILFLLQILSGVVFVVLFRKLMEIIKVYRKSALARVSKKALGYLTAGLKFVFQILLKAAGFIGRKVSNVFDRLRPAYGKYRIRRYTDERSAVFNIFNRQGAVTLQKLKWQGDNRQKVRYTFIKFLKRRIREGVPITPSHTPNEIYRQLRLGEEGYALFDIYNKARYKNDIARISDDDVKTAQQCASMFNKKTGR